MAEREISGGWMAQTPKGFWLLRVFFAPNEDRAWDHLVDDGGFRSAEGAKALGWTLHAVLIAPLPAPPDASETEGGL